ncbi:nacht and ankyrin domain [Fusarium longipes]|uniref:Nacht and ankyrin domain n=1 Tax=Fusarium longipes TaxID=694270 RepID=A0A395RWI8_9HYPO|nr:nacht and ankyrin domain [Fusarium longipes]
MSPLETVKMVRSALVHPDLLLTCSDTETITGKINSCRNALFISHPDIDREALASAKGRRADGTCEWILQNPYYQSWLAREFPVFRISGGPGKGKTVLSLFLTEALQARCQATGCRLIFFFCRFQDERFNDPRNVLRSLAYQLLEYNDDYQEVEDILNYFETAEKTKDVLSNLEGLWKIVKTLLSQPNLPTIVCIVDGIDECHSSGTLLGKLYEYCHNQEQDYSQIKFQLLILGRDVANSDALHVINLDEEHKRSVRNDVENFIASELEQIQGVPRFKEIRSDITAALVEKAEGIFLWVSFVIAEVNRKRTCLQIRDTVESFPQGLNPAFARMLQGIEPRYRQTSESMLQWIMFAERPLTLKELAAAIAETEHERLSEQDLDVMADMIQIWRPFLEVHENRVFFVHQSAKEYLMEIRQESGSPLDGYFFVANQCHGIIALKCLKILRRRYSRCQDTGDRHILFLFNYSKEYWDCHARVSATCPVDITGPFFENMVLEDGSITEPSGTDPLYQASSLGIVRWLEALYKHRKAYWTKQVNCCISPLSAAIVGNGDRTTIRFLLEHGADSKASMARAFIEATDRWQLATVELLLDHGVMLNDSIKERVQLQFWNLLMSFKGHTNSRDPLPVSSLSENGLASSVLGTDTDRSTLLSHAIELGCDDIVRAILDHGIDIDSGEYCSNGSPLFTAVLPLRHHVLEVLLDYGANPEVKNSMGETPLHEASSSYLGGTDSVKVLLKHRANVEAKDPAGRTPLMFATRVRNYDEARCLLDHGADINAVDNSNKSALMLALVNGNQDSMEFLLNCGARLTIDEVAQSEDPLVLIATEQRSGRLLSFVLGMGADIDRKSSDGATPLVSTLVWCKTPYFTDLERYADSWINTEYHGAEEDISSLSHFRLFVKSSGNSIRPTRPLSLQPQEMVKCLLNNGADKDLCGRIYLCEPFLNDDGTKESRIERSIEETSGGVVLDAQPIVCAAIIGLDWAITLLMEYGADLNARATEVYLPKPNSDYRISSIFGRFRSKRGEEGARSGDYDRLRMLEHARTRTGGSALVYASMVGHLTCVRLLLTYGADATIEDSFGMTALDWAREEGFTAIEQALIEHDQDGK